MKCHRFKLLLLSAGSMLASSIVVAQSENNVADLEDIGFEEMDSEAARLSEPTNMENEVSPLNAEMSNPAENLPDETPAEKFEEAPKKTAPQPAAPGNPKSQNAAKQTNTAQEPLNQATAQPAANAAAPQNAAATNAATTNVATPKNAVPVNNATPIPTDNAAPTNNATPTNNAAAQQNATQQNAVPAADNAAKNAQNADAGKAANATPAAVPAPQPAKQVETKPAAANGLGPNAPAAVVPKISGGNDVSGTPENTAMEPVPGDEAQVQAAPAVAPAPQNAAAAAAPATAPSPAAAAESAAATIPAEIPLQDAATPEATFVDREGESPGPDAGPIPRELIPMNEFGGVPTFVGGRRIMAEGEAPDDYKVEAGDTLFDICDQLVDDPAYWPKLWALNPEIANPHFIYPGMKLRFYPGDEETPPFLQIVNEDDFVPVDKAEIKPEQLVTENLEHLIYRKEEIEPPKEPDVPNFVSEDELRNIDISQEFEDMGTVFVPTDYNVMLPSFVYEDKIEPLATVKSGAGGELLVHDKQKVLLQSESGKVAAGMLYTVVRYSGEIERPSDGERIGYRYEFIAQIKVTGVVATATIAEVALNRLGLQPGDLVTAYQSVQRKVPMQVAEASSSGSGSQVLAFGDPNTNIGGNRSLVFLDKTGSELSPGATVFVYQDSKRFQSRFIDHQIPNLSRAIAKIHIIDSSTKVAIGMVMDNSGEVYRGDYAGTPVAAQ